MNPYPDNVTAGMIDDAAPYLRDNETYCSLCGGIFHVNDVADCGQCKAKDLCDGCGQKHVCIVQGGEEMSERAAIVTLCGVLILACGVCAWMGWGA